MKQKLQNTKEKGLFRFVVFREKDNDYCAVCLDLNIVEYGKDPEKLRKSIFEAAFSYLEAVRKEKLSDGFLNKPAPKRFWEKAMKMQTNFFDQSKLRQKFFSAVFKPNQSVAFCSLLQQYGNNSGLGVTNNC